jgi:predicted AlkP superfamily pyrophosphatase or phosphodiesterase
MDTSLATPPQQAMVPDYAGGSIVNLMATITAAFDARNRLYPVLRNPDLASLLRERDRVVLIVVDGLGANYLARYPGSGLHRHLHGSLTSVFPSTTATAITTFLTGLAPAQHGLTGWHMYFSEIATVGAVLPLRTRRADEPLAFLGFDPAVTFDYRPVFDHLPVRSFVVSPERIVNSEFNRAHTGGAQRRGYGSLEQFFDSILNCLRATRQPCYTYAYYADFDSTAHEHGVGSAQVAQILQRFDAAFSAFLRAAVGQDATVVVTADHGFIDSPPDRLIALEEHPFLEATLRLPLCGERRAAYCYVQPGKSRDFEEYVDGVFAEQAWVYRSESLVEQGWFGPGEPHPRLKSRIGDYTLVMKDNWTIKDWLAGEKRYRQIGVHGGVTADEMLVPLVVVQP